jgi:hypothetical protein
MCLTLMIASTAVSAVGAYQQAQAQKAQAEYSAQVQRNNAIIAEQNMADIIQRGDVALEKQRQRVRQTVGTARAAMSGSGLLLGGTPGETTSLLEEDLRTAGQMDILTLRGNIEREARRAEIQGINYQAQAGLFDLQASSISPFLSAATAGFKVGQSSGLFDQIYTG